jgi:hypothetical protein
MLAIFWPLVIFVTVILYGLLLLFLPFSPQAATIMLFSIISFWSRLPGVGIPSPFYILYLTDLVDFFSMILAINIGGIPAAIFTFLINMVSRAAGNFPNWIAVFDDAVAQALVCLIIPFVHVLTGGDILVTMVWYSVLRLIVNIPIIMLIPDGTSLPRLIVEVIVSGSALIAINAFYARLFGNFFDSLLKGGVEFSWILFLLVTIVIFLFRGSLMGKKTRIEKPAKAKGFAKKLQDELNLRLYLFKTSPVMKRFRRFFG